ncbi:DUF4357 domain-containing protein [Atopobium fossor]|uniref:DUF4357 domain-containing protein n=1 Tax=Atopobium fossor TaxID=39487 RepID=UPI000420E586|nr:DUF4357 domain-containing protein [Atopobium fossor]
MFLDVDSNIDRDVLDALEAKAIKYVNEHGSYETDNSVIPSTHSNPYKEEAVDNLFERILFRMEVLGYDLNRIESTYVVEESIFHTKRNGIRAQGRYDVNTGRFTVLPESDIDLSRDVIKNQTAAIMREQIFGNQKVKAVLNCEIEFSSPSTAAVFVLGGSQNGWTEWINARNQTLDFVYRQQN